VRGASQPVRNSQTEASGTERASVDRVAARSVKVAEGGEQAVRYLSEIALTTQPDDANRVRQVNEFSGILVGDQQTDSSPSSQAAFHGRP
jgi:hypothetical protein